MHSIQTRTHKPDSEVRATQLEWDDEDLVVVEKPVDKADDKKAEPDKATHAQTTETKAPTAAPSAPSLESVRAALKRVDDHLYGLNGCSVYWKTATDLLASIRSMLAEIENKETRPIASCTTSSAPPTQLKCCCYWS